MKKLLILFGGNSVEHEISCMSVNFIIDNIDNKSFNFELVGIDLENNWYRVDKTKFVNKNWKINILNKIDNIINYLKKFDIVFPLIHGNTGEDGKLQSIFELYNIKYVGSNSYSSIICYDKLLTKLILEKYNIPQVPYTIYNNENMKNIEFPVIIKPCKCGSSIGINIAKNKKDLLKAIKEAKKYDSNIVIEKYLDNKIELECAIIEKNNKLITSNIGQINNASFYDYSAKYSTKTNTSIANIDKKIINKIKYYSKKIFKTLQCKDLARIDFLYDLNSEKLYFNEINTIPGFTETSMYPTLINNLGISSKKMLNILMNL